MEGDLALVPSAHTWSAVGSDAQSNKMRGLAVIFITTYKIKQLSTDDHKTLTGRYPDKCAPTTAKARNILAQ